MVTMARTQAWRRAGGTADGNARSAPPERTMDNALSSGHGRWPVAAPGSVPGCAPAAALARCAATNSDEPDGLAVCLLVNTGEIIAYE